MGTPPPVQANNEADDLDEPSMLDLEAPKKQERKLTLHEQLKAATKNNASTTRKFQLMYDYFNANKYEQETAKYDEIAFEDKKRPAEKPKVRARSILLNCMDSRVKRASDPFLRAKEQAYKTKVKSCYI